jgi:pimeloyl-ACP methyl ester carboxylesterase
MQTVEKEPHQGFFWGLNPQGFHKISYLEWGDESNPEVLICVHGLTRNAHDFDYLARKVQKKYRIACPDLIGHGKSDYIGHSEAYTFTQYMNDMVSFLSRINAKKIHWLGTSIGGIVGMMLAAQPGSPIKSLILNDVGMIVPSMSLHRVGTYARNNKGFASFDAAKSYFQTVLAPNGILGEQKWNHVTKHGTYIDEKGELYLAYDPTIGQIFVNQAVPTLHLETYWQGIKCPILVLRGEYSDFLPPEIIRKMLYFQPNAKIITIPDCGHAPSLMEPQQIQYVEDWLEDIKRDGDKI